MLIEVAGTDGYEHINEVTVEDALVVAHVAVARVLLAVEPGRTDQRRTDMTVPGLLSRFAMMAERGLVDVEIVKKGDGTYQDGQTRPATDVQIRTNRGHAVWVDQKDVIARKPNPETPDPA